MFILSERTMHEYSHWIVWRLVHPAHNPWGLSLSLCNKQSTDKTTKICQDYRASASGNPCKKNSRGSLKIRNHWWDVGFDAGVKEPCDYLAQCLAVKPGITPKSCQNSHANVNPTAVRGNTGEIGIALLEL